MQLRRMKARSPNAGSRAFTAGLGAAIALATCLAQVGCGNGTPEDAREAFARAHSCPEERVHVTPRPDIKWSTVEGLSREIPPDEVKKDPARLAKWRRDQEEQYAPLRELLDKHNVFEARGCDHDDLVGCVRPAKSNGANRVICQVSTKPVPKTK
jgi:hypothetical protein